MIDPTRALAGTATTSSTVRAADVTVGQEQVTVAPGWQLPSSDAVAETSVVPAGTGSFTVRLLALDGPPLAA